MDKKERTSDEVKFRKDISQHTKKRKFTNLSNREIHKILEIKLQKPLKYWIKSIAFEVLLEHDYI